MKKIVLFASGSGSNAEKIILHFEKNSQVNVVGIFTNNPNAKVLDRAKKYNIPAEIVTKTELEQQEFLEKILAINPDLIVLAGFLLKFPAAIIENFPNKVINIHPALLPKYGGKGMYGMNVHRAILENKDLESGITIHYVNEHYDEGEFIFQQNVSISECLTAEEIAEKVHELEHLHFPEVIERLLES
jgi:phosphoribosylglycinamide formyltransferase-1